MRKHNYVVGYEGEGCGVYGEFGHIELMTLSKARKICKGTRFKNRGADRPVIYKLVRVR